MPVPKPTVEESPRRLLRDVVFDRLLAAIQDGTLQRGERLNDDELVRWLGVSRTPIREAIAKLVDIGLVEMEANRYTRIATPSIDDYTSALQMFVGLQELAVRWGMPKLDDAGIASLQSDIEQAREHAAAHDPAILTDVLSIWARFVKAAENSALSAVSTSLSQRVQFLAVPESAQFSWEIEKFLGSLQSALEQRDPDAGGRAVRYLSAVVDEHIENLRKSR